MSALFGDPHLYEKPAFITYVNSSSFSLYLLPILGKYAWRKRHYKYEPLFRPLENREDEEDVVAAAAAAAAEITQNQGYNTLSAADGSNGEYLGVYQTFRLAFCFSILWFAANYTSNASLSYTNVPTFTMLSSLSGVFTLLMSSIYGAEKFTMIKVGGLTMSIIGSVIVSFEDLKNEENSSGKYIILGNTLAIAGALFYAIYTVLLKVSIVHESRISMVLFFGFVGIITFFIYWPFLVLLSITGIEPFALPPSVHVWELVLLNSLFTCISEILWVLAMLMTSPMVVTVGISLSIPLSLFVDLLFKGETKSLIYISGALCMILAFLAVHFENSREESENLLE